MQVSAGSWSCSAGAWSRSAGTGSSSFRGGSRASGSWAGAAGARPDVGGFRSSLARKRKASGGGGRAPFLRVRKRRTCTMDLKRSVLRNLRILLILRDMNRFFLSVRCHPSKAASDSCRRVRQTWQSSEAARGTFQKMYVNSLVKLCGHPLSSLLPRLSRSIKAYLKAEPFEELESGRKRG